ncbi:hypothetical protein [Mycetocola reblochoni]|uniref:hypothetical protein n=1 Tax=Mycetocola reblochoni TaxID=331618 RepID=UPI000B358093|nr:hypothetical protein [Mycetocola reblochoni]
MPAGSASRRPRARARRAAVVGIVCAALTAGALVAAPASAAPAVAAAEQQHPDAVVTEPGTIALTLPGALAELDGEAVVLAGPDGLSLLPIADAVTTPEDGHAAAGPRLLIASTTDTAGTAETTVAVTELDATSGYRLAVLSTLAPGASVDDGLPPGIDADVVSDGDGSEAWTDELVPDAAAALAAGGSAGLSVAAEPSGRVSADAGSDVASAADAAADAGDAGTDPNAASGRSSTDDGTTGTDAEDPEPGTEQDVSTQLSVSDVTFDWGINKESNGGAYFGGCNFLSAGVSGDAGSARVWGSPDGLYSAQEGNVSIVRPTADGRGLTTASWATRCTTPSGTSVNGKTTNAADSHTQSRVRIVDGVGTIDPANNTARIRWSGSFTVVYYGGMTYWSATDPVLSVASDGTGTLSAVLSGAQADMDDPSVWGLIAPRQVTLATFTGVTVADGSLQLTPDYAGVSIPDDVAGRNPQAAKTAENASWWGAFPGQFLTFQMLTGQSSYWYTTDGGANTIQPRKVASEVGVDIGESVAVAGYLPDTLRTVEDVERAITDTTVQDVTHKVKGMPEKPTTATALDLEQPVARAATPPGPDAEDAGAQDAASEDAHAEDELPVELWYIGDRSLLARGTVTGDEPFAYTLASGTLAEGTGYLLAATPHGVTAVEVDVVAAPRPDDGSGGSSGSDDGGAGGSGGGTVTASGAVFDWGINRESTGGAYFGGCNFLSAGVAGDTGGARVWTSADGLYRSTSGNTRIVRAGADGSLDQPDWSERCLTASGDSVNGRTTNAADSVTGARVRIENGTGSFDAEANTATVRWDGSFTVAYYGGMSYWSASDPVLTVDADGSGVVTATLSGYAADMDDLSHWGRLAPRSVVIATLSDVTVTASGFTVTPDYLDVAIPRDIAGRNAQATRSADNASWWGAFPAEFLRFQVLTGQSSYWYTTDGSRNSIQPRKAALPITVCATADCTAPPSTAGVSGDDIRLDNGAPQAPAPAAAAGRLAAATTATASAAIAAAAPLAASAQAAVTEIVVRAPGLVAALGAEYLVLALLLLVAAGLGLVVVAAASGGVVLLSSAASRSPRGSAPPPPSPPPGPGTSASDTGGTP